MRAIRTLTAVVLAASLLASPGLASGQTEPDAEAPAMPLARQPDGRLPLAGTPWRLVSYVDGGRSVEPGPEVAAFIRFGPRFFSGSGGCSKLEGTYGLNGAALSLRPRRSKERDCADPLAQVQEAVEAGLRRAAAYAIEPGASAMADQLVIYSVAGSEALRFAVDDRSALDGVDWRLESYTRDGQLVEASEEPTGHLAFRPDSDAFYKRRQSGRVTASTGCNGIVGDFTRRADVLRVSALERTDAPCTVELGAQEAAMVAVLAAPTIDIVLPADRLILTSRDSGDRLEFASQPSLEGTTWWLQRTAAEGNTRNGRVTLRLEEGTAGGEGPCGPFSARYVTDGIFITFTEAVGARDDACPELRSEQALISGLRRSVRVERGPGRLAFRDAYGDSQLEFGRPFEP